MNAEHNSDDYGWNEAKHQWKENRWLWLIPGLILGIVIGFLLGISSSADLDNWFIDGIWPELLSTTIAIALIYHLDKWRDGIREQNRLKADLLWQVKSRARDIAVSALDRLKYEGWLEGDKGLLKKIDFKGRAPKWSEADLVRANLEEARLVGAELQKVNLEKANLQYAQLAGANLRNSELKYAILRGASLSYADLREANLDNADMQWCELSGANLQSASFMEVNLLHSDLTMINGQNTNFFCADLRSADLRGANLKDAYLLGVDVRAVEWIDQSFGPTILPDGTPFQTESDVLRFVDPDHENVWIPPRIKSFSDFTVMMDLLVARQLKNHRNSMPKDEEIWMPRLLREEFELEEDTKVIWVDPADEDEED